MKESVSKLMGHFSKNTITYVYAFSIIALICAIIFINTVMIDNIEPEATELYSLECLYEYAVDYCNGSVIISKDFFSCIIDDNLRTKTKEISSPTYFLPSELESCTILQLNSSDEND